MGRWASRSLFCFVSFGSRAITEKRPIEKLFGANGWENEMLGGTGL